MRPFPLLLLAGTICLAAAPAAQAGAWLREKGGGMLDAAYEYSKTSTGSWGYVSLYGEYGLTPRFTIGLDAGSGDGGDDWKALLYLRTGREIGALPGRVAIELALGAAGTPAGQAEGVIRSGLSWGNSFETELGWAWVNIDAKGEFRLGPDVDNFDATTGYVPWELSEGYKLDLTLGLNAGRRTQLVMEIRAEDPSKGAQKMRIVPSVAHRIAGPVWLRLGGIVGVTNDDSAGLVLGTRIEF